MGVNKIRYKSISNTTKSASLNLYLLSSGTLFALAYLASYIF